MLTFFFHNSFLVVATSSIGWPSEVRVRSLYVSVLWVLLCILERGEWIVDREVVADTEDPSEVQRLAIKYLRSLFGNKNRVLAAEACFDRVRSKGTDAIYVVPQWAVEKRRPGSEERPAKRTKIN